MFDNIVPPGDEKAKKAADDVKAINYNFLYRLDVAVLRWMHVIVSQDILNSIFKINDLAQKCWKKINVIFKTITLEVIYLKNQFSNTNLKDFSINSNLRTETKFLIKGA